MVRNTTSKTEKALIDLMRHPATDRQPLREREIEQLQDIIIRAHYLSMELRDICAVSDVGSRHMSLVAGRMLKSWALAFAQELERVTNPPDSP